METFIKIISYLVWGLWRFIFVTVAGIIFFAIWFWPVLYFEEDSNFTFLWITSYAFIVFYGLSVWHVISEDERKLNIRSKIKSGLLVAFNKMLFAFLAFGIFILVLMFIRGG